MLKWPIFLFLCEFYFENQAILKVMFDWCEHWSIVVHGIMPKRHPTFHQGKCFKR